jgi:hypothetical protein
MLRRRPDDQIQPQLFGFSPSADFGADGPSEKTLAKKARTGKKVRRVREETDSSSSSNDDDSSDDDDEDEHGGALVTIAQILGR